MAVIIKTLKTPGGYYVYDRETNSLLSLTEEEYIACQQVERGEACVADLAVLKRYTMQGYLMETRLKKIIHPATSLLRHQLNNHIQQITLQCTQSCNLRCSYCIYSGNYKNQRVHTGGTMSHTTMKKAIDFAFSHSRKTENLAIAFYGGDPLLELESIIACVDYIDTKYSGRSVKYTLTTNGTLFSDAAIHFLHKNDFSVSVSLDGPKFIHDVNRVYADGRGSFDDIFERLSYIKEHFPEFFKKISFLSVIAPGVDFSCVNNFYNVEDILSDATVAHGTVNYYSAKEDVLYDDLFNITNGYHQMKSLLSALGMYSKEKVSKLYMTNLTSAERVHKQLSKIHFHENMHPGGPCLPGVMRPFIAIDGSIYPCERLCESLVMKIGHVDTGIDVQKAEKMLNIGNLTEAECMNCWCFVQCGLCVAACDDGESMSRDEKLKYCRLTEHNALITLLTICLLIEHGYDFERSVVRE